jgi:hypothetical protein
VPLIAGKPARETAAALFLSPKTVEYHLRHVYQKLDIHSREERAQRLGRARRQLMTLPQADRERRCVAGSLLLNELIFAGRAMHE